MTQQEIDATFTAWLETKNLKLDGEKINALFREALREAYRAGYIRGERSATIR